MSWESKAPGNARNPSEKRSFTNLWFLVMQTLKQRLGKADSKVKIETVRCAGQPT